MFAFIGLAGLAAFVAGVVMVVVSLVKKNNESRNKWLKVLVAGLVVFVGALALDPEPAKPQPPKAEVKAEVKKEEPKKDESKKVEVKAETKAEAPKQEKKKGYNHELALKELKADFKANEQLVEDVFVVVDEDKKELKFSLVVNAAVNDKYILEIIDSMLRKYNLFCFAGGSNKEKWGNLYDEYSIVVGVASKANINNPDKWFVYEGVAKGVQTQHKFKVKRK